jgi:hypothetical protein
MRSEAGEGIFFFFRLFLVCALLALTPAAHAGNYLGRFVVVVDEDVDPAPGEEVQKLLERMYATPPELIKRAAEAIGFKPSEGN